MCEYFFFRERNGRVVCVGEHLAVSGQVSLTGATVIVVILNLKKSRICVTCGSWSEVTVYQSIFDNHCRAGILRDNGRGW